MVQPVASGRVIGSRYRLERELGSGAFGEVWLAADSMQGGEVVVKLLHPQWAVVPAVVERFRREAQASQRIRHPSACRVFDHGITEDRIPYIAMEYLTGGTLRLELTRSGRLATARVAQWMIPVCEAVSFAHAAGIVHRDLKPENIMMKHEDGRDVPVVLDFGIAKLLDAENKLTQTGSILGSPAYMSPEQCQGRIDIGPAADVYSLAIIVFELCHGTPPFVSKSFAEMAVKHSIDPPPPLVGVPPQLAQAVAACLVKEPENRPPIAHLASALRSAARETRPTPQPARAAAPSGADPHSAPTMLSTGTGKEIEEALTALRKARKKPAGPPAVAIAGFVALLGALGVAIGWLIAR